MLDGVVEPAVVLVAALGSAQRHRADEHGEEAVAVQDLGQSVDGGDQRQPEHRLTDVREAQVVPLRAGRHLAEDPAARQPDERADGDLADQLHPDPVPAPLRDRPLGGEEQREPHEREGQGVVEPGLGREGEAHLVVLLLGALLLAADARPGDLHVRREHRVGGSEHGAEQDGGGR